jgi:hypothetical protein
MSPRVSFTLLNPLVAFTKDHATTTIPGGAVVEMRKPIIGDMVEVEWDGQVHSVSLNNLLRACKDSVREECG